MKSIAFATLALALAACGKSDPPRPTEEDEARFHEIDAMLDEASEGGDVVANVVLDEEGATSEDAAPSE